MLGAVAPTSQLPPRLQMYASVLHQLRIVMISTMAKPEEVVIVEDSCGNIVRETMKDTDAITLYKNMREVLVYLTNLHTDDTLDLMIMKLSKQAWRPATKKRRRAPEQRAQADSSEYSFHNLNTLCWAIGSVSSTLVRSALLRAPVQQQQQRHGVCVCAHVRRPRRKRRPFWCVLSATSSTSSSRRRARCAVPHGGERGRCSELWRVVLRRSTRR